MNKDLEAVIRMKDLAKAGDLFSLPDHEIERGCNDALSLISELVSQPEYVTLESHQSVVEVCITRITSAIRETSSINEHVLSLVSLLRTCLSFNLRPTSHRSDAPHAKIVSDVLSFIFQHYSNDMVMEVATPVAVLFLDKANVELTRNITSYLSLAVINHARLVSPQVDCIITSLQNGNKALLKLLSALYDAGPDYLCEEENVAGLVKLITSEERSESSAIESSSEDELKNLKLNSTETSTVLEVLKKICTRKPQVMVKHLRALTEHLSNPEHSVIVLSMFDLVTRENAGSCTDFKESLMEVAKSQPELASQVARLMGRIGRLNEIEAEECIDYFGNQLGSADTSYLPTILKQLLLIGQSFPDLLKTHMDTVATFGESKEVEVKRLVARLLELLNTGETQPPSRAATLEYQKGGSLSKLYKRTGSNDKTIGATEVSVRSRRSPRPPSVTSASSDQTNANNSVSQTQDVPYKDPVHKFCEKHFAKIQTYIDKLSNILPLPVKCTVEEKKKKKTRYVRLYFTCSKREGNCLYPAQSFFTLKSRLPKLWIHLMFLNLQAKSSGSALRQDSSSVAALGTCWECIQTDRSDSFVRLVTSSFPSDKEMQTLRQELFEERFFDVISLEPICRAWACFMCNNPERLSGFIKPDGTPGITGQLKEKKGGRWKLFKRWKKRYFTLSGDNITYQKTGNKLEKLDISHIASVRACRKRPRDAPRAFEIFTESGDTYKFKAEDHTKVERWVQCLNLAISKQQRKSGGARFYNTVG